MTIPSSSYFRIGREMEKSSFSLVRPGLRHALGTESRSSVMHISQPDVFHIFFLLVFLLTFWTTNLLILPVCPCPGSTVCIISSLGFELFHCLQSLSFLFGPELVDHLGTQIIWHNLVSGIFLCNMLDRLHQLKGPPHPTNLLQFFKWNYTSTHFIHVTYYLMSCNLESLWYSW